VFTGSGPLAGAAQPGVAVAPEERRGAKEREMATQQHQHQHRRHSQHQHERQHQPEEGLNLPQDRSGLPSGATPPAESSISDLGAPEREALRKGWAAMPLTIIFIVVALVVVGLIGMAVILIAT